MPAKWQCEAGVSGSPVRCSRWAIATRVNVQRSIVHLCRVHAAMWGSGRLRIVTGKEARGGPY
jgi:hypothetical protein